MLLRPLQAHLSQNKTNRIKLSEPAKLAFFQLKETISQHTKFFYYYEGYPIFLLTNASEQDICRYLYQLIDNIENPIAFISKSLIGLNSDGKYSRKKPSLSTTPSKIYWEIGYLPPHRP